MKNVDPIRYAWEGCNLGVAFPAALARSATTTSVATILSNAYDEPRVPRAVTGVDAAQTALLSFILGPFRDSSSSQSLPEVSTDVFGV